MEYENTLLIVESPEIARRINRLTIPYLTTFSTDGFLWWPKLSPNNNRLTLKARTEQNGVEKRRALKEFSSYAVKIICATDHDPSGEFIAWSVERYLKRSCIHHTLNDLSKSGILNVIQKEEKEHNLPEPNVLHGLMLLQNFEQGLSQKLLYILFDDILKYQNIYFPPADSTDFILFAQRFLRKKTVTLPNLLAEIQDKTGLTLKEIYDETWNLFLHQEALITYPRSVNRGFYDETWLQYPVQSPITNLPVCLSDIRPVLKSGSAHESIRVTNIQILPEETKKWLSKAQRMIYSYIWEQTHAIFYPEYEEIGTAWKREKKCDTMNNPNNSQKTTISAIYEVAASYGLIRNSNIYKTLSYLHPDKLSTKSDSHTDQKPLQKHFNELYEWLKHPMNHPKKRNELQKISGEILKLRKR